MARKKTEMLKVFRIFSLLSLLVCFPFMKADSEEHSPSREESVVEKFNASKLIMEHIADSY